MIDLSPLEPLADRSVTTLPFYTGDGRVMVGYLGATRFIVTLETDGHCEISLSSNKRAATDAQVDAFFRKLGVPRPSQEDPRARRCRMFTVVDTRPLYNQ